MARKTRSNSSKTTPIVPQSPASEGSGLCNAQSLTPTDPAVKKHTLDVCDANDVPGKKV